MEAASTLLRAPAHQGLFCPILPGGFTDGDEPTHRVIEKTPSEQGIVSRETRDLIQASTARKVARQALLSHLLSDLRQARIEDDDREVRIETGAENVFMELAEQATECLLWSDGIHYVASVTRDGGAFLGLDCSLSGKQLNIFVSPTGDRVHVVKLAANGQVTERLGPPDSVDLSKASEWVVR
ncbi:MAG: hypothetical protein IH851_10815 [Armatimonadetes bacterium]|nr:hypothetical protein [Armatimonadota bacterium]